MDSNTGGSVQYDRWNEDIDMNIAASQPATTRWDVLKWKDRSYVCVN